MRIQVKKNHYVFSSYATKRRWASIWHQLDEVINKNPRRVLEIGPGPGIFKATALAFGVHCETLDIDPELNPDHVASVFNMPFQDGTFDVVCAFQMLEHLPFNESLEAFAEMCRVSNKAVIISLPDAATQWPFSLYFPKIGEIKFLLPKPYFQARTHEFDGQHYWEVNKKGYSLNEVISKLTSVSLKFRLNRTYRVMDNPYHRFFIFGE